MSVYRVGTNKSSINNFPSIRPSLDLDFANTKALDPRITFTRSSGGSYVGADGILRYAGVNEARFDHNPVTGESLGLLIEESRTNLLANSEDFSNAVWIKFNLNLGSTFITSPNGQSTAYKLIANSTNLAHQLFSVSSGTINTTYTLSMYVKAGEYSRFGFGPGNAAVGGNDRIVRINLNATNPILSQDAIFNNSAFVTSVGNGWYRVGATWTATSTGTMTLGLLSRLQNNSGSDIFSGDGTSGIYLWGAQLEVGAFPTSYIPTTASTVTRSADRASMTGTNFSSWYNSSEGTVVASYQYNTNPAGINCGIFSLTSNLSDRSNVIDFFTTAFTIYYNSTAQVYEFGGPFNPNVRHKGAFSFTTNKFSKSVDGSLYISQQSASVNLKSGIKIPTVNILVLGPYWAGVRETNGTISRLTYYPKALPPSQLQALTR